MSLHQSGAKANVSLKLTQFGLDLSGDSECRDNVEQLARRAAEIGGFVRVDMESSDYVDRTLGPGYRTCTRHLPGGRYGNPGLPVPLAG
jgi:hypothetical protein